MPLASQRSRHFVSNVAKSYCGGRVEAGVLALLFVPSSFFFARDGVAVPVVFLCVISFSALRHRVLPRIAGRHEPERRWTKKCPPPLQGRKATHSATFAVPPCFCCRLAAIVSKGADTPRFGNGNTRRPLRTLKSGSRSRLARELPRTHTPVCTNHRLSDGRNPTYFPRSMPCLYAFVTLSVHDNGGEMQEDGKRCCDTMPTRTTRVQQRAGAER